MFENFSTLFKSSIAREKRERERKKEKERREREREEKREREREKRERKKEKERERREERGEKFCFEVHYFLTVFLVSIYIITRYRTSSTLNQLLF